MFSQLYAEKFNESFFEKSWYTKYAVIIESIEWAPLKCLV